MQKDREILRGLANKYLEASQSLNNINKLKNWINFNEGRPAVSPIMIDQIPWHEINIDDELTLRCQDGFCRTIEDTLRKALYKDKYFDTDMVLEPYIRVPKTIINSGIGIEIQENRISTDDNNNIVSHHYSDQIPDEEALSRLHTPDIRFDIETTTRHRDIAMDLIGDIIPIKMNGLYMKFNIWDRLAEFRGIEPLLYDMYDRPEFIHSIMKKFLEIETELTEKYANAGLLEKTPGVIQCSGIYSDKQENSGINTEKVDTHELWASGMAQMLATVSKEMHDEFEIEYAKQYYSRFKYVYYGCCEPFHKKMDLVKKIGNVRKVSISPWADVNISAQAISNEFIMSRKPNPAFVANGLNVDAVKNEIEVTLKACRESGTSCEFILKDISTVSYKTDTLIEWSKLVRSIINNF